MGGTAALSHVEYRRATPADADSLARLMADESVYAPGKRVVAHPGQVHGNAVRAKPVGRDIFASLNKLVGGELKGYTERMQEARQQVIAAVRLREERAS